jgi:hypothetical protein
VCTAAERKACSWVTFLVPGSSTTEAPSFAFWVTDCTVLVCPAFATPNVSNGKLITRYVDLFLLRLIRLLIKRQGDKILLLIDSVRMSLRYFLCLNVNMYSWVRSLDGENFSILAIGLRRYVRIYGTQVGMLVFRPFFYQRGNKYLLDHTFCFLCVGIFAAVWCVPTAQKGRRSVPRNWAVDLDLGYHS